MRESHNFDSLEFETTVNSLFIQDHAWITTGSTILPSCKSIAKGCVIGSQSVVSKNLLEMEIVAGNPCRLIKTRKVLPLKLNNCVLHGVDLVYYFKARFYEDN